MERENPTASDEAPRKTVRMDADALGIDEVVAKDGTKIDVEVNAEEAALDQELRLSEPLLGMMKEMNSMKNFDACTEEQISEALDCRWVKVWKLMS